MKSINQISGAAIANMTIRLSFLFLFSLLAASKLQAADKDNGIEAIGGSVYYTLHIGKDIITRNAELLDDSYLFDGKESAIAIADPNAMFYIGIVKKGAFTSGKISLATDVASNDYTLAHYLVYNDDTHTMEAIAFENGFTSITVSDSGAYHVSFMYTLKEKNTGKLITLKGEAQFDTEKIALQ